MRGTSRRHPEQALPFTRRAIPPAGDKPDIRCAGIETITEGRTRHVPLNNNHICVTIHEVRVSTWSATRLAFHPPDRSCFSSHRTEGGVNRNLVSGEPALVKGRVEFAAIGSEHRLDACTWGHAGDGNLHATLLLDPADADELARAWRAADAILSLAIELGGTISGEHGIGLLKRGRLRDQWSPAAVAAHRAIKQALDPRGIFNPGKKEA